MTLPSRALGRTSLSVTRIGLGLAALGRPGYINLGHAADLDQNYDIEAMRLRTCEMLDEAWHLGIRYFDAAQSYGRAEEFLSSWLSSRNFGSEQPIVASKWGYTYTADWRVQAEKHEVKEHTLPVLERQWPESRTRLGPRLRLYQIHSATLESGVLSNIAVLGKLHEIKTKGVFVGLTLSGPRQAEVLDAAMNIRCDGSPLFDCVQATWNLLEPSAGATLSEAHERGMGVVVKEALANGRLTSRNRDTSFSAKLKLLMNLASEVGTTIDALAIAAVCAKPWADVVLSGAATLAQLRSNVKGLNVEWKEESEAGLDLAEAPETYWQKRSRLRWN